MARGNSLMGSTSPANGMLPWLGLALIVLIVDQFTKILILGYFQYGDSTPVTSFFNIVRAHNTGAAFSFLAAASGLQRWLFTTIGVAATLFILESMTREGQDVLWDTWGLDHAKIPGSHSKAEVDQAEARGAKFVEANVQFMMSYPEQDAIRKQTQEIMSRAGQ